MRALLQMRALLKNACVIKKCVHNYKMRALLLATKNLCAHNIRLYALQLCVRHMSECILVVCNFLKDVRLGGWGTEGP